MVSAAAIFTRHLPKHGQSQVGDLSKIAKVILQFTDKYCHESTSGERWEHTTWVVAPVVALLRGKLQSVAYRAASIWFFKYSCIFLHTTVYSA